MAEVSALEDKFEAWAQEDENKPIRKPAKPLSKAPISAPRLTSVQNRSQP